MRKNNLSKEENEYLDYIGKVISEDFKKIAEVQLINEQQERLADFVLWLRHDKPED